MPSAEYPETTMMPLVRTIRPLSVLATAGVLTLGGTGCGAVSDADSRASNTPHAPVTAAESNSAEAGAAQSSPTESAPEDLASQVPAPGNEGEGSDATSAPAEPQDPAAVSTATNVDATPLSEDDQRHASELAAQAMADMLNGDYEKACDAFVFIDFDSKKYGTPSEIGALDMCLQTLEVSKGIFESGDGEYDAALKDPANLSVENEQPGFGLVKFMNGNIGWLAVKLSDGRVKLAVQR
ncbi:hypothetical protein [Dermabacter vaginalis]|uniref:Uncharacterized protein n=1 Tax=Dermabacter vaginalis TaxID=1630135 RepID=A0ABX6A1V5_9MICO|nr:hypothetical protein [Dermabacter vaginalis]QEU11134.1 hypothetical protein FOB48_01665 [Dermabacter vaginalis]